MCHRTQESGLWRLSRPVWWGLQASAGKPKDRECLRGASRLDRQPRAKPQATVVLSAIPAPAAAGRARARPLAMGACL